MQKLFFKKLGAACIVKSKFFRTEAILKPIEKPASIWEQNTKGSNNRRTIRMMPDTDSDIIKRDKQLKNTTNR